MPELLINKQLALSQLFYLTKNILGKDKLEIEPHLPFCEFIQNWGKKDRKLALMPRGSYKSTIGAIAYPLWLLIQPPNSPHTFPHLSNKGGNRNMRVLLDGEVRNKTSARNLNDIKGLIESSRFKSLFGDMHPKGPGWQSDQIWLSIRQPGIFGEPSVTIGGVDIEETGLHFDLVVADDLVGETNVNTREQLEKTKRHFQHYINLLDPGGRLLILGTPWHHQDLYHYILDNAELLANFDKIKWPAKNEQGKLLFPQVLSEDFLARAKTEQGSFYYPQYMLEVTAGEDSIVKKDDISYFKVVDGEIWIQQEGAYRPKSLKISDLNITLTCDEAHSKAKYADYTGVDVKGEDKDGNWYILLSKRGRWSESELQSEIEMVYQKYPIITGGLESTRYDLLARDLSQRGIHVIELKHRGRSKFIRFRALEPRFARHKIYIQKSQTNLEYEILCWMATGFRGVHDDEVDALAYQADLGSFAPRKEKARAIVGYFDEYTGY